MTSVSMSCGNREGRAIVRVVSAIKVKVKVKVKGRWKTAASCTVLNVWLRG